jgi:pseudaminic acid synthase
MNNKIKIGHKFISDTSPTFIIAEMSANHLHKKDNAFKIIDEAAKAGVDAIKLQTYTAETITVNSHRDEFQIKGGLWDGRNLYELYEEAYTPWEWQPELKKYAESKGLICFSSPFDKSAVDFLEKMDVPAYKVASFEIEDIPLIRYIASKGKPVIISTGIADENKIKDAVEACKEMGNHDVILLKCTSEYPTPLEDMNLKAIPYIKDKFGVFTGLSDHSEGIEASISAISLGAKVIEKHFTLSRKDGGPDAAFSLEPHEMKNLVNSIRKTEKALGRATCELPKGTLDRFGRCLMAIKDIDENEQFTDMNIGSKRPKIEGADVPKNIENYIGKIANRKIQMGEGINKNCVKTM